MFARLTSQPLRSAFVVAAGVIGACALWPLAQAVTINPQPATQSSSQDVGASRAATSTINRTSPAIHTEQPLTHAPPSATTTERTIIYVNANTSPNHDQTGESWSTAFHSLDQALAAVGSPPEAYQIWIAAGTYVPSTMYGTDPQNRLFAFPGSLEVYGGFAGYESSRDERNWMANETVLSGDLNGDDGPGFTNRGDNSHEVVWLMGSQYDAPMTVVDGVTVRGGNNISYAGGGMDIFDTRARIAHCTFADNHAEGGGAVHAELSELEVVDCRFIGNRANGYGGAMHVYNGIRLLLSGCMFLGNTAETGGAIGTYSRGGGEQFVVSCLFLANEAQEGGAVFTNSSRSSFTGCLFTFNRAQHGGAISSEGGAGGRGGSGVVATPLLTNCTLHGNRAVEGGGVYTGGHAQAAVHNSVLWGNTSESATGEEAQVAYAGASPIVAYSNVEGWTGTLGGEGNIGADPRFIDPDGPDDVPGTLDDDLRVSFPSPCIDAGSNAFVPPDQFDIDGDGDTNGPLPIDLGGEPRFLDDPRIADTGAGSPPIVDMGAFEFNSDCNHNGMLDDIDLIGGTSFDCDTNGQPDECGPDCNGNQFADSCDIKAGTSVDCNTNGMPDDCEIETNDALDCNGNQTIDECEIATGTSLDCNGNGVPDECDLAAHPALDCNGNDILDVCELTAGTSPDCDNNGVLDKCDLASRGDHRFDPPPGTPNHSGFGESVAISGDLVVIGAPNELLANGQRGRVYVYQYSAGSWALEAALAAPDSTSRWFGERVAIDEDTLAVCAWRINSQQRLGTNVHVYRRLNGVWVTETLLAITEPEVVGPHAVTLDGDMLVVASYPVRSFRRYSSGWVEESGPQYQDPGSVQSLALAGEMLAMGIPFDSELAQWAGAVRVYGYDDQTWPLRAVLHPSDAASKDMLGWSVATDGHVLVSGATQRAENQVRMGAAYVYRLNQSETNGEWVEEQILLPSDGQAYDYFGSGVAVERNVIVVGADGHRQGGNIGAAYVFRYDGANWHEEAELLPTAGLPLSWFGFSVAVNRRTAVIGSSSDDYVSPGVAYIFDVTFDCNSNGVPDICEADCDGDSVPDDCEVCGDLDSDADVDADDYALFRLALRSSEGDAAFDACADYDNSGAVGIRDYLEWIECYRAFVANPEADPPGQPVIDRASTSDEEVDSPSGGS